MTDTTRRALFSAIPIGAVGAATIGTRQRPVARTDSASAHLAPVPQQFGAVGDGRADDSDALAAWLAVGAAGTTLRLPSGQYRTTRTLAIRIGGKGRGLGIVGDGAANTMLLMDGSVDRPALRIVGNMPEFDHLRLSGIRIERPDRGMNGFGNGAGLLIENVRQFELDDLRTFRNGYGVHLIGCLVGRIDNLLSYYDRQGIRLEQGKYQSTPNVIAIDSCSILASLRIGVEIVAGTSVSMRGTTIESTGVEAPGQRSVGLFVGQSGLAGGVAIDASALYFEDNHGSDIVVDHPDRLLTYGFTRCVFNRFAKSALAPAIVFGSQNGPGAARAFLDLSGSAFLGHGGDYRAVRTRPAVRFDFPRGYAGVRLFDDSALYQFDEERPAAEPFRIG
nr:glycosyl hydrolase family 28-related protein [Sphingomonas sp. Leaf5]